MNKLTDQVSDELKDAGEYAECASLSSDTLSKTTYIELSKQEIEHAHKLQKLLAACNLNDKDKVVVDYLSDIWGEMEEKTLFKLSRIKT